MYYFGSEITETKCYKQPKLIEYLHLSWPFSWLGEGLEGLRNKAHTNLRESTSRPGKNYNV